MELNKIYNEDCLIGMNRIPDKSVDMILCDLPYGNTRNKWDVVIPFAPIWQQYERIIKDNGVIVLTGTGKFSAKLLLSNERLYRYTLIWEKTRASNFLNANKMPLENHEDILVFYKRLPVYNPQKEMGKPYIRSRSGLSTNYDTLNGADTTTINSGDRHPKSVIKIANPNFDSLHPTQKPIELFSYLIRTYTNPGDIVLDNCLGSGTTAISCIQEGRNYIGFEKDEQYYNVCMERIEKELAKPEQLKLIV